MGFAWTIVVLVVLLAISWRFLGSYMAAVFEGRVRWLSLVERPIYRVAGVDAKSEQTWKRYSASVIIFSGFALLFSYAIFRLQGVLPFNPQHLPGVAPALAWNTAVSFVTNTNWQAYSGETTMSYLSQMGSLAVQNFVSAAVGIAVAVALIRGFQRKGSKTIGNFWVDLVRHRPLHPAADRVRLRGRLHGAGRDPDAGRPGSHLRRAQRRASDHSARARSPRRRSSSSWGRTAAGSSTQTAPARSRTRPA